jgi:hypothetical protein
MTDLERVLSSLLHDLRSPLGVAGGYLRLLREGRLTSADDTERALVKTQDALRMMTGLCADATSWLDLEPPPAPRRYALASFLALVGAHAESQMLTLDLPVPGPAVGLTLSGHDDAVARAVTVLIGAVAATGTRRCAAICSDTELCFSVRDPTAPEFPAGAFDPWRYRGLAAPLACRVIREAGGRCVGGTATQEPLRVSFTLEPLAASPGAH